jgi:hypothetical protein
MLFNRKTGELMKRLVLMITVIILLIIDIAMIIDMITYGIEPFFKFATLMAGMIFLAFLLYFSIRMKDAS